SLQESQEATHNEYSELLSELPFWIFDKEDHSRRFDNSSFKGQPGYCCFTHAVGLPLKPGFGYLPWFDYQHEFLNLHQKTKYIRIIKATGLGFSEITLYLVAWLAFQRYFNTKDAQVPILTGPRIDLAQGLIDRLHNILMQRNPLDMSALIRKTSTVIQIGRTFIEAFPSHHIDAVRALTNPIYILLDEADFFPYAAEDVNDPVKVVERYILKSNPWIVLVSTPGLPGGLYDTMDHAQTRYTTLRFNYEWGLDKIYDSTQIENAKKSPSFEREYNLKYGFGTGNIYDTSWIALALLKGERLRHIPVSPNTSKSMGLDPAYGSSKFGITLIEYMKYTQDPDYMNTKRVFLSKGYERERYEDMLDLCYSFIKKYNISYTFIDGSQVEFIKSLKSLIGEDSNYEEIVKRAKKFNTPLYEYMNVIPLLNQEYGAKLVQDGKYWMGQ